MMCASVELDCFYPKQLYDTCISPFKIVNCFLNIFFFIYSQFYFYDLGGYEMMNLVNEL